MPRSLVLFSVIPLMSGKITIPDLGKAYNGKNWFYEFFLFAGYFGRRGSGTAAVFVFGFEEIFGSTGDGA
jgi:hypothetical protein